MVATTRFDICSASSKNKQTCERLLSRKLIRIACCHYIFSHKTMKRVPSLSQKCLANLCLATGSLHYGNTNCPGGCASQWNIDRCTSQYRHARSRDANPSCASERRKSDHSRFPHGGGRLYSVLTLPRPEWWVKVHKVYAT